MPLTYKALPTAVALIPGLLLCWLLTVVTLEASSMPRPSYADTPRFQAQSPVPADPFGAALLTLLDDAGDVASERVWQEIPRLIAQQWQSFSQHQSPLSTMGMISRAAETVLKIRLASRRGGGEEEARRLEEFQALMADIWGAGEGGTLVADEGGGPE